MDSVTALAPSVAARYQGTARSLDDPARGQAAAANAQQPPTPATTVTLSRRAQELAARERQDETQDDARAAAQAQQSASAAEAAQEARRTQTAQVAERADADSTRAQAYAQLRRAYANPEGAGAR